MPFNAKVKKTGELFEAINEENSSSNVQVLEEGKSYCGYLYAGQFDSVSAADGYTVFRRTDRTPAKFSADELEEIKIPLRIKAKRKNKGLTRGL
jgi:hypothetical protein